MSRTQQSQKKVAASQRDKTPMGKTLAVIKVRGLLQAYESHCMKMGCCVSAVLREDVSRCVNIQKLLTKV